MRKLVCILLMLSCLALLFSQANTVVKEGHATAATIMKANVQTDRNINNNQVTTPVFNPSVQIPDNASTETRAARTASVTGNWNATATWGGSSVPVAGDAVTINSGVTVTVTANAACTSIAMSSNSTLTINGTNSLTVSAAVTMPRPTAGNLCTLNVNAGTMSIGTTLTMSATTVGRNDVINITTGSLTINGTTTAGTTGCIVNFTGAGSLTYGGALTGSPTTTTFSGSHLNIGWTGTLTAAQSTAITLVAGSNLNYTGAGAQTIYTRTYAGNLGLSGAGTKTIAASATVTVSGNLNNSSTLVLTAGTSTTSTYLVMAGNVTNTGTITSTAAYTQFYFAGTLAQSFTNNGTMTAPVTSFVVQNAAGLTLLGSNQTIVTRINMFYGTVTNSNKLTFGTGGTSYAVVQRGVAANTSPAGRFDVSPTFNLGSGGYNLLYDNGSVAYNTGYEVPNTNTTSLLYVFDAADVSLNSDLTISSELNFYGGTGTPILRIGAHTLTLGGTITYTVAGTFYGSTSSNLIMNGSTTLNAVTNGLNNLTINANNTIGGAVTVNGTLTLTSGILSNGANLTMATGTTISRAAGSLTNAPTFAGTVNLLYTGSSPITAGKELATGASVINNLTTNTGGFTQFAYNSGTTNLLTDAFPNLTSWTGNIGTAAGQYNSVASVLAGGVTPEVDFIGAATHSASSTTYYIYRGPVNTTGYTAVNVSFKTNTVGTYTQNFPTYLKLQSATSTSGPWHDVWSIPYAVLAAQTISIPNYSTNVGGNMYFQFAYVGDYYATDHWYLDDLVVNGVTVTPIASSITVNGTLNLVGNYTIGSGNTLTMANNATINRSGGTLSTAPTFGTSVNLIYTGTNAFSTGVENPGTGINNLSVNNSSVGGITLGRATTVGGALSLTTALSIGANTLTINGTIPTITGGITGGSSSDIVIGGTPALSLPAIAPLVRNFTINRSGGISLGSNLTVNGVLTFVSGAITLGNYSLNPAGSVSGTPNIIYNGSGAASNAGSTSQVAITAPTSGTLPPIVNTLTVNYAGTVTLPSNVEVGNLTVTSGNLDLNSNTLTFTGVPYLVFPGTGVVTSLGASETTNVMMPARIDRQWSISGGVTSNLHATFTWTTADDGNYAWTGLLPAVFQGSTKLTTISSGLRSITVAIPSIAAKDIFTVGLDLGEGALPVELSSFTATFSTSQFLVNLLWITESETNNMGFNVLRSDNMNVASAISLNSQIIQGTNTSSSTTYSFADETVEAPNTYYYWLENMDYNGSSRLNGPVMVQVLDQDNPQDPPVIPVVTKLCSAYPNPFNPQTYIAYDLKTAGNVRIEIFNTIGQHIRTLVDTYSNAGHYTVAWNGTDANGRSVSSGVYIYRMKAGQYSKSQKVVMMK